MIGKVSGLARALGILLAVIAGFVAIPNVNVALVLVVLGLIGGLSQDAGSTPKVILAVLVLPVVGAALGNIPEVGSQLGAVAANVALGGASLVATVIAIRLYQVVKDEVTGLLAK